MATERDHSRLRRYVLGSLTEDECDVVEREYFEHAEALDPVSAAEDDLIDDYLSDHLAHTEREQFERHYLSSPAHRRRVDVARAIRKAASMRALESHSRITRWWAAAAIAASLLLVAGSTWMMRSRLPAGSPAVIPPAPTRAAKTSPPPSGGSGSRQPDGAARSTPPAAVPAPTVVVTVSISPILVRGADKASTVTITPGTDVVRVLLQRGEGNERPVGQGRAIVRTVGGREVWRGPAVRATDSPRQELARLEIPAALLRPDDYIVELLGTESRREVEWQRYFLRVRTP